VNDATIAHQRRASDGRVSKRAATAKGGCCGARRESRLRSAPRGDQKLRARDIFVNVTMSDDTIVDKQPTVMSPIGVMPDMNV